MTWKMSRNTMKGSGRTYTQAVLTRESDGKVIRSTWWGAGDGSAECEADELRREFLRKEAEEDKRKAAQEDLEDWDPNKCSCHISPPCGYCENGEYKEP